MQYENKIFEPVIVVIYSLPLSEAQLSIHETQIMKNKGYMTYFKALHF